MRTGLLIVAGVLALLALIWVLALVLAPKVERRNRDESSAVVVGWSVTRSYDGGPDRITVELEAPSAHAPHAVRVAGDWHADWSDAR